MVMASNKTEKAIIQARANMAIDKIYVSDKFVETYKKKRGLPVPTGPKLILLRGGKNGNNK
jgi:hypothetical protein